MEAVNEYIHINGVRQSILTMRTGTDRPVLLIVHGGAGCPDRPLVCEYSAELAEHYTVVCWDQRGCGFSDAGGRLAVDTLLSDLKEVVAYLLKTYAQDRIYIAGHSWGSYLALRYAQAYPHTVKYYIGTGQEISAIASEPDKNRFAREQAQKRNDKRVLKKLDAFGAPEEYILQKNGRRAKNYVYKTVFRYSGYFSKNGPSPGKYLASYVKLYGKCYGAKLPKALLGLARSVFVLNAEMDRKDSISHITELTFPVLLISGEEDMICPADAAQRWFNALSAPKKTFVKIKNASHMVNFEQPGEWNRLVVDLLSE